MEATFETKCESTMIKLKVWEVEDKLYCIGVNKVYGDVNYFIKLFEDIKVFVHEEL